MDDLLVTRFGAALGIALLVLVAFLLGPQSRVFADAHISTGSGDWNLASTWAPDSVPEPGDTVTILSGHTVTVSNAHTIAAVTVEAGGTLANNSTLTISGALSGGGSLVQGVSSTLGLAAAAAPTITTLDTTTNQPNTVRYEGAAQTASSITYSNLTFAGSGEKTWTPSTVNGAFTVSGTATYTASASLTMGGDLNVQGGTLSSANTIQVYGSTTISGTGTFAITSVTGTKTFNGDVIISGGTWDNSAVAEPVSLGGSLTLVSGTFLSGAPVYTMTGNGATLSGSLTVAALTVSGTGNVTASGSPTVGALVITAPSTVTNDGSLTVTTSITGTGTMVNATNRTLFIQGTAASTVTGFDMTTNTPNTVDYNRSDGSSQTLRTNSTYHHLVLSGDGTKLLGTGSVVRGNLTVSGSAQWTRTTAAFELLGNLVVDSSHVTPVTATTGALTFSTPSPTAATAITGTSAASLTLGVVAFDNQAGVSSSKTLNPTTVTVGGGASFTSNGTFTPTTLTVSGSYINNSAFTATTLTVSGSASATNNSTLNTTTLTVSGGGTFTNNAAATTTVAGTTSVGSTGTAVNHGTMIANGLISGPGSLVNRANAILEFGMSAANVPTITTLDLSTHTPNTVRYNLAGAQSIRAGAYSNLELTNSGIKTALGSLAVSRTFTLSGTAAFTTGAFSHTFTGSWVYDSTVATPLVATGSTVSFNAPSPAAGTSISGAGTGTLAFAAINIGNASGLTVSKPITSTGPLQVTGLLTNSAAGSVTMLSSGNVTVANGGTLTNAGTLNMSSGGTLVVGPTGAATATNTGTLTLAACSTARGRSPME